MNHFWFANRLYRVIFFTSGLPCENETKTYISSDKEREEFRMRKFKKALAFALASAMIVSAAPVSAATTNSAKGTKSTIYTYTVDKSKKADANNKRSWIKVTAKKGYTYKLVNKTTDIVSLTKTRVEAKKAGTAKINVNFYKNGKYVETKSVKITVKKAPMIGAVSLSKDTVNVGETATVSNAGKGTAYFYSSNKDVATVDKTTGEIKALAGGTTTISAVNTITKARVYLTLTVVADAPVATQTGANTITITNGVAMDKSTVKVTKGSATVKTDSIESQADGKTITIKTDDKLTAGTYTVTVGDKTVDVTAQTEKVSAIKILSEKAAVVAPEDGSSTYKEATVGYKVENQFGENITDSTTLQVNGTGVNTTTVSNGKVTFKNDNGFIPNRDVVNVVLMHTATGTVAQATLTVSDVARISTLEYKGVYNADNKTLNENSDPEDFYLLFKAVDQYNNEVTSKDDFVLNKDVYITLAGTTNLTVDTKSKVKEITKDGEKYIGVQLKYGALKDRNNKEYLSAGTTSLTAIAAGSGKTVNANVDVAAGNTIDSISFAIPSTITAGEEVVVDYTALDRSGNAVTDYNALSRITITNPSDGTLTLRKVSGNKGEFVFKYTGSDIDASTSRIVTVSLLTPTNKASVIQFTVQKATQAKSIKGMSNDSGEIKGTLVSGAEVKVSSLSIKDQYGRTISSSNVASSLGSDLAIVADITNVSGSSIEVTKGDNAKQDGNLIYIDAAGIKSSSEVIFKLKSKDGKKAEGTVTFYLAKKDAYKTKADGTSGATVDVSLVDPSESSTVKASVKGKVYVPETKADAAAFKQGFDVKVDGVSLDSKEYTITSNNTSALTVVGNNVYANSDSKDLTFDANGELKTTVTLTTPYTDPQTIEVVLTNKKPSISTVTLTSSTVEVATGDAIKIDGSKVMVGSTSVVKSVKDSYGVTHTIDNITANTAEADLINPINTSFTVLNDIATYSSGSYVVKDNASGKTVVLNINYGGATANLTIKVK